MKEGEHNMDEIYFTSEDILNNEEIKKKWNDIVPHTGEVLEKIVMSRKKYSKNAEKELCEKCCELEKRYLDVLFLSKLIYDRSKTLNALMENRITELNSFEVQKAVRYYLIDCGSIIEYLNKFIEKLETLEFKRKEDLNEVINSIKKLNQKEKIRDIRNMEVHENIPRIVINFEKGNSVPINCPSYSTDHKVDSVKEYKIVFDGKNGDEIVFESSFVSNLWENIKRVIIEINKILNSE